MTLSDLVRDPGTGMLSHTKLWANVGYAVLSWAFVADALQGHLTDMKMLVFGGVFGLSATASKWLSMRFGGKEQA